MADYIIANGQTLSNQNFGYGDTILVKNGGTLVDSVIPRDVVSVSLETGAILSGTIRTAKEVTTSGSVNASSADLILDISDRKPEEPIMVSAWSLLSSKTLTVAVDSNQDKGTYRLFGNASGYSGTITVAYSFGTTLGTLSLENPELDFDITHYLLSLNEDNELCLTVSSNIPDTTSYVLLYRDTTLIDHAKSFSGITIPGADDSAGNKLIVLKKGVADQITLHDGGTIQYYPGATVTNLNIDIPERGASNIHFHAVFDGNEETGELTGTHRYGAFSYQDKVLKDFVVFQQSEVIVQNGVEVNGIYLAPHGSITIKSGSTVTGEIRKFDFSGWGGHTIYMAVYDGVMRDVDIYETYPFPLSLTVNNCELTNITTLVSGSTHYASVIDWTNRRLYLKKSTITDSFIDNLLSEGGSRIGNVKAIYLSVSNGTTQLIGDISLTYRFSVNGYLDANGHMITIDMTHRKLIDGYFVENISHVSEDAVYKLIVRSITAPGKYRLASGVCNNMFQIVTDSDPDTVIGVLSVDQRKISAGIWDYELVFNGNIDLSISLNENAGAASRPGEF